MRRTFVYVVLILVWILTVVWQSFEHTRIRESARSALVNRAGDFALALGVVIRSQGRFGFVPQEKIDAALDELAKSTEVESVMLLNKAGAITAAAGDNIPQDPSALLQAQQHWNLDSATFVNLVALGPNTEDTGASETAALIVAPPDDRHAPPPNDAESPDLHGPMWDDVLTDDQRAELLGMMTGTPLTTAQVSRIIGFFPEDMSDPARRETIRRTLEGRPLDVATLQDVMFLASMPRKMEPPPDENQPRRPPWMSDEEYEQFQRERGVHWFLVTMSTDSVKAESIRDLRLRAVIVTVLFLACLAVAIAWRAMHRSTDLQLRLVRAEEMTSHLRELNMAAAGLVHETKNPLNLIRGLAQMISRATDPIDPTQETAVKITEEADRVTGRLNQFLDYSRPVEPKWAVVEVAPLVERLFDILTPDTEDKAVSFRSTGPNLIVEADEDNLRQLLFNLIINAIDAVPDGGRVEVRTLTDGRGYGTIEVRDDGPGVSEKMESDIFRPYFTNSEQGTGLGLAVVRQIALAHGWEVRYVREAETGAVFRVNGVRLHTGASHERKS